MHTDVTQFPTGSSPGPSAGAGGRPNSLGTAAHRFANSHMRSLVGSGP